MRRRSSPKSASAPAACCARRSRPPAAARLLRAVPRCPAACSRGLSLIARCRRGCVAVGAPAFRLFRLRAPPCRRRAGAAPRRRRARRIPRRRRPCPTSVSCAASPANQTVLRAAAPSGRGARAGRRAPRPKRRPAHTARRSSASRVRALDRFFHVGAVEAGQPFGGEVDHRRLALARRDRGRSCRRHRPSKAACPRHWPGSRRCACCPISRTPGRRSPARADCRRVPARCGRSCRARACSQASSWRLGSVGRELDGAGSDHVGRHGDDRGARRDRASRGLHRHVPRRTVDRGRRRRQLNREVPRREPVNKPPKPCRQKHRLSRSADLAKIDRRDLREILAAAIGAEHEFDRRPPVAEIVRQRLRAGASALRAASAMARLRAPRRRENPPARPRAHSAGRCAPSGWAAPDRCRAPPAARASPPD